MKTALKTIADRANELAEILEHGGTVEPYDLRMIARTAEAQHEMIELGLTEAGE